MSEGLFTPVQRTVPFVSVDTLSGSMVRILPKTELVLNWASTHANAQALARNESLPNGSECWYRYFTLEDVGCVNDPAFSMGMVRHEFARVITSGASLPASVSLEGGGSGFAISPSGLVLTNYHLVTSEIAHHRREAGHIGVEVPCNSLRAQVARRLDDGQWEWHEAAKVWLVSNPPESCAIHINSDNTGVLREDVALLRVEPAPPAWLRLSSRVLTPRVRVWMAGFPLRTARSSEALHSVGYSDADGSLRVSEGLVTEVEGENYFSTDCDGSMGNSGSPIFDETGEVVGLFSRIAGNGPKNAVEYGHTPRVQVSSGLAERALALNERLQPGD